MICISIGNKAQLEIVNAMKPDMLELRFDMMNEDPASVLSGVEGAPGIIATCRPDKLNNSDRMLILKNAIDAGVQFIDIEIDADLSYLSDLIDYAKGRSTEIIISWHDFEKTPTQEKLKEILKECYDKGADIAKIACQVNYEKDNSNLLSLYSIEGRKVVLGMGDMGKITRIAALYLGAEFTFVSSDAENATAPGQLTYSEFTALNKILQAL